MVEVNSYKEIAQLIEEDPIRGLRELQKLADKGDPIAQYQIGRQYVDGILGNDLKKAFEYFILSANQGYEEACFVVGLCYLNGTSEFGCDKDIDKARNYLKQASENNIEAQWKLYHLYVDNSYGERFTEDSEAIQYLKKAAYNGHERAALLLAWGYAHGDLSQLAGDSNSFEIEKNDEKANELLQSLIVSDNPDIRELAYDLRKKIQNRSNSSYGSSSENEGCYIATAVYGDYFSPEVMTLRVFRDHVLLKSWYGKIIVKIYYTFSPSVAKKMKNHTRINKVVRSVLDIFVAECRKKRKGNYHY